MSASMDIPHSQNTAPVLEFRCLYTADIRRKQKRWQDGRLKFHTFNKRVMVYDEKSNFVGDTHWKGGLDFEEGEELELERGGILVEVGECIGRKDQDLSELVDKRVKEREERAAAKIAQASPSAPFVRNQGSPSGTALLRPKPLNYLLTPTGHYGRAAVPTTSPFEGRQVAKQDENEPPAKRRKQADTTSSKSGYAQNLMGATLSLSSSKPSSTPTIRYEPFRARPVQHMQPDTIDLTADDDEERRASDARRKFAREQRAAIERLPPKQNYHKKSPPVRSGYASSLTGTPLILSRSGIRPSVRTTTTKASIRLNIEDKDSASESEDDDKDRKSVANRPSQMAKSRVATSYRLKYAEQASSEEESSIDMEAVTRRSCHTMKEKTSALRRPQDIQTISSDEQDSSADSEASPEPPTKMMKKEKSTIRESDYVIESGSFDQNQDCLGNVELSPMAAPLGRTSNEIRPTATRSLSDCESSSTIEINSSPKKPAQVQEKQKQKKFPVTKLARAQQAHQSFQPRSSSSPPNKGGTPGLKFAGSFDGLSSVQNLSTVEPTPDRSMSTLRIKSRPRQKMMMLMNRSNSRASDSNTSFESVRQTGKPPPKPIAASNERILSKATSRQDLFLEIQNGQSKSRLTCTSSKSQLEDISDLDSGIGHTTIDSLLTREPNHTQNLVQQVSLACPESSIFQRSPSPPPVLSSGKDLLAAPSGSVKIDQSSQSREDLPALKAATEKTRRKTEMEKPSKLVEPAPPLTKLPDPTRDEFLLDSSYHTNETTIPGSQTALQDRCSASVPSQRDSAMPPAEKVRTATESAILPRRTAKSSPAAREPQNISPEINIPRERDPSEQPREESKSPVPEALRDPKIESILLKGQHLTGSNKFSIGNNSSYDDNIEVCFAPSVGPEHLKHQSSAILSNVEVLGNASGGMRSSTSRFRAMMNPSSNAKPMPPRTVSPPVDSMFSKCVIPQESRSGLENTTDEFTLKVRPPSAEWSKERPEPSSGTDFNAPAIYAASSTPDLASNASKMAPPKARLANPATRGKSLQTLAANTSDTMSTLFNPMPPPVARIPSRVERYLERANSDAVEASESLFKEAPVGGPWSREAFDLFGIHGPPRLETGPGIPAT